MAAQDGSHVAIVVLIACYLASFAAAGLGMAIRHGWTPRPIPGGRFAATALLRARDSLARIARFVASARKAFAWRPRSPRRFRPGAAGPAAAIGDHVAAALLAAAAAPFRMLAFLRSRPVVDALGRWFRNLDAAPCPRWLSAAAERLAADLAVYAVHDRLEVRYANCVDPLALAWYPKWSQFETGRPVFAVTHAFVSYVLDRYEEAGGVRAGATLRDLSRSTVYVLAHEYGHALVELAFVMHEIGGAARVGASPAVARRLWTLLAAWRAPLRGAEEAFCDDLAAFIRGADPSFLRDDSVELRELMAPPVKLALRLHGVLVSGLDDGDWRVLRDLVRARVLAARLRDTDPTGPEPRAGETASAWARARLDAEPRRTIQACPSLR